MPPFDAAAPTPLGSSPPGDQRPRVTLAVSLTIFALLTLPGALLLRTLAEFATHATLMFLVYVVPALRLRSPAEVRGHWRGLLAWVLAGTFLWDLATALLLARRPFLSEWYLVYASGPLFFGPLYLLHGWIARTLQHVADAGPRPEVV